MSHFYTLASRRLFSALALAFCAYTQAFSQGGATPIYSNSGNSGATVIQDCNTVLGVTTCFGSVTNAGLATDASFTTAASIDVQASALVTKSIKLGMDMDGLVPAGYRAGIMVEHDGSLLSLGVSAAPTIRIRTYLSSNGGASQLQEVKTVDASVVTALLGTDTGPTPLSFVTTKPFDQIELEAASLVSLGYKLKVYYAFGIGQNTIQTAKGYVSRFAAPNTSNYSTATVDNGITVCVNPNISNPLNAVDSDLSNFATMGSLLDLSCPMSLQTQLEGTAPAGYYAGFVLGSAGLLDASVLSGLRLTTYLGSTVQEVGTGNGLLNLKVLPSGQYEIHMNTTLPYDRVELRRVSLLGALNNLRIYYGFGLEPRVYRDLNAHFSNFSSSTGNFQLTDSNLLCLNCTVTNPGNTVDQDLISNFATYTALTASVGSTTRLKMRINGGGKAGNRAGVVMGLSTGLLDAQLLNNLRVKTYGGADGSQLLETIADPSLLTLDVLASGKQEVSFRTTRDFEWVELELKNAVSALDAMRIFYAFADDAPTGFPSTITPPVSSSVALQNLRAVNGDGSIDVTWQTTAEANSSHFIVERSLSSTGSFQSLGRVNAAGNSTTTRQYIYRDYDGISQNASTLYYRLRIVDLGGQEVLSSVVAVTVRPPVVVFDLYPNPASSSQQVRMQMPSGKVGTKYQVAVYDQMGTEVSRHTVTNNGRSAISPTSLRPGFYQVALLDKNGQRLALRRLVIQP